MSFGGLPRFDLTLSGSYREAEDETSESAGEMGEVHTYSGGPK